MNLPFLRCKDEQGYYYWHALLLVELCWRPEVRTVVPTNLFAFPEYLGQLHYLQKWPYLKCELYFQSNVRESPNTFEGRHNVKLFSL